MGKKISVTLLAILAISIVWSSIPNQVSCAEPSQATDNFERSYTFSIQNGYYLSEHTLYVAFPPSVAEYYAGKSRIVYGMMDYAKFVTPNAVKSVAENIRSCTSESPYADEEFANAVLMIVHQIPYVKSDAKYPVETFVDNQADCDGVSVLAASLMKAGGLDVVLFLYDDINPSHMNIGVSFEQMPVSHSWWVAPEGFEYDNKTYWMAECTSLADWNVGDRPSLLEGVKPKVIPLTSNYTDSPAQVSSSLDCPMQPSLLSIKLTAGYLDNTTRIINASGSLSPPTPNQKVTLYVNQPSYAPTAYRTLTDEFGNYSLTWNITFPGTYIMKTSCSGSENYSGSDSDAITVFIGTQAPIVTEFFNEISTRQITLAPPSSQFPSWYLALLNQGSREFLKSNLTGKDIVLSGDFMVLSDGSEISMNATTVKIPSHPITFRVHGSRRIVTITVPEEVRTIPGAELLNSYFGFMLQQNEQENYTAIVKVLGDEDISQIDHDASDSSALFINATNFAEKETWYKAVTKVNEENLATEVYDMNGTRLQGLSKNRNSQNLSRVGVLMTYQTGQIIAFKSLNIEKTAPKATSAAKELPQENEQKVVYTYIRSSFLSAGAILAVISFVQRRKRNS